jgi:hypothetical protein
MKARDFCFWLQGYFEMREQGLAIPAQQAETIRKHLSLVFKHEIDPEMGPPEHQAALNAAHAPTVGPAAPATHAPTVGPAAPATHTPFAGAIYDGIGSGIMRC